MPFRTFEVENKNSFVNLLLTCFNLLLRPSNDTLENEIADVGIAHVDFILAHLLGGMSGLIKETNPHLQHGIERRSEIAHILFDF